MNPLEQLANAAARRDGYQDHADRAGEVVRDMAVELYYWHGRRDAGITAGDIANAAGVARNTLYVWRDQ